MAPSVTFKYKKLFNGASADTWYSETLLQQLKTKRTPKASKNSAAKLQHITHKKTETILKKWQISFKSYSNTVLWIQIVIICSFGCTLPFNFFSHLCTSCHFWWGRCLLPSVTAANVYVVPLEQNLLKLNTHSLVQSDTQNRNVSPIINLCEGYLNQRTYDWKSQD